MKKKGVMTFDMIMYIPRLFFIMIVGSLIAYLIWSFITLNTDVKYQEAHVLANTVLYSSNGISYKDIYTSRTYPGVIDPLKFQDNSALEIMFNHLDEDLQPDNDFVAIKVVLSDFEEPPAWDNKTIYLNEWNYKRWESISKINAEGAGGAKLLTFTKYVLIKRADTLERAKLNISIVMPNE